MDAAGSVRIAGSLSDLARAEGAAERSSLLAALEAIDPFFAPFEHPLRHLTVCAQAARELVATPGYQVVESQQQAILTAYETGLLNGYDAVTEAFEHAGGGDFALAENAAVYALAWRHGNAIRLRWRAYAHLVSILMGGRQS
ncbi:MAG: hypothetical protein QE484_03930 [Rhizobium sp.]|nr:hypothetical protein [Rhizobium sp.]